MTRHCDSVSVCLSKGLGAPLGSVLLGAADFIVRARRWRKVLGGGMRQAGIVAAAGSYALDHHVARLADDHRRAAVLAAALRDMGFVANHATNMVLLDPQAGFDDLIEHLAAARIRIRGPRWVTHLDIDDAGIDRVIETMRTFRR